MQWQWRKRRWQQEGLFSWRRSLAEAHHPVLSVLIAFILFLYVAMIIAGGGNPLAPFSPDILDKFGFAFPALITEHGEYWRIMTAVFLHFNIWHILFNCIALYQVGQYIEQEYGGARFLIIFVLTGIAGNVLQLYLMHSAGVLAGASGAVFGLIGFCGLHAHLTGNIALRRMMFQWAIYSFIFGFFIRAANLAHFGGFVAGLGLGVLIPVYRFSRRGEITVFRGIALFAAGVVGYCFYETVLHWQGVNAFEECYRALSEKRIEDARVPCEKAKRLLPGYPEAENNWKVLQELLHRDSL